MAAIISSDLITAKAAEKVRKKAEKAAKRARKEAREEKAQKKRIALAKKILRWAVVAMGVILVLAIVILFNLLEHLLEFDFIRTSAITFGILLIVFGVPAKALNLRLHKVHPNKATVIEIFGGWLKMTLNPGLYVLADNKYLLSIGHDNLSTAEISLEPIAGLDENWDEITTSRHLNIDTINWANAPRVEFSDGSSGLVELLLVLQVVDPIKATYTSENPLDTIVSYAKTMARRNFSSMSFSEALKSTKTTDPDKHNILGRLKEMANDLDYGIELIIPEDRMLVKNFHPSPETKEFRDAMFKAKAEGKALVEMAKGKAKADAKIGKGWGKKMLAKAKKAGIDVHLALANENLELVTTNLGDKAVIITSGDDTSGGLLKTLLTASAVHGQQALPQQPDQNDQDTNDGGDN